MWYDIIRLIEGDNYGKQTRTDKYKELRASLSDKEEKE